MHIIVHCKSCKKNLIYLHIRVLCASVCMDVQEQEHIKASTRTRTRIHSSLIRWSTDKKMECVCVCRAHHLTHLLFIVRVYKMCILYAQIIINMYNIVFSGEICTRAHCTVSRTHSVSLYLSIRCRQSISKKKWKKYHNNNSNNQPHNNYDYRFIRPF